MVSPRDQMAGIPIGIGRREAMLMTSFDNQEKFGLVIQGPIVSSGKTGVTPEYHIAKQTGRLANYNAKSNVQRLVADFGHLFDQVVLSTWESEDVSDLQDHLNVVTSNSSDYEEFFQIGGRPDFRFHQIGSTLRGVEFLESRGIEHVLKVRTDQYLSIAPILDRWREVIKSDERNRDRILVPSFDLEDPTRINDFYFLGLTRRLKEIFRPYVDTGLALHHSIHHDLFWNAVIQNILLSEQHTRLGLFRRFFQHPEVLRRNERELIESMWQEIFIPGPTVSLTSIEWRGEKLLDGHPIVRRHSETPIFGSGALSALRPARFSCRARIEKLLFRWTTWRAFKNYRKKGQSISNERIRRGTYERAIRLLTKACEKIRSLRFPSVT